jgi:hypothetical protein
MMAFVSLFTVVALCSCNKDENEDDENGGNGENAWIQNNTINVVIENNAQYSSEIDTVKVQVGVSGNDDYYYLTLASVPYNNGKFTIKLPESINKQYLYNVFEELEIMDHGEIPEGITISNQNIKGCYMGLYAYKSGLPHNQGGFCYYGTEDGDWTGELIYMDGDVSITGTGTFYWPYDWADTYKCNIHLEKGWNMVYEKNNKKTDQWYEVEYTTQAPAGAKWYFTYH